jgi:hypothetical protein
MALQPRQSRPQTAARIATRRVHESGSAAPAFIRADYRRSSPRVIVNIQGVEKSGKNHMAFSYTGGPIYVHSFDVGLEGVVEKFQDDHDIYVAEYELTIQPGEDTPEAVGQAANKVWESFVSNYKDSIESTKDGGLVVVDTGTEAWELLRLASFGKLTQVMPHMYSKPNAEFRDLVRTSYDGSSVAWLHKMVPEWENYIDSKGQEKGKKTGNLTRKGMNDIGFLVQMTVETWKEQVEGGGANFHATVIDCRTNPGIEGMELENDLDQLIQLATEL